MRKSLLFAIYDINSKSYSSRTFSIFLNTNYRTNRMTIKKLIRLLFVISLLSVLLKASFSIWIALIIVYFVLSIINLKNVFQQKFPLGEFVSLIFFIENTFALTLLYLIKGKELTIGSNYYSMIEIEEYLPFSFLAAQCLLIGYFFIDIAKEPWQNFVRNFNSIVRKDEVIQLLLLGLAGTFIASLNISSIAYISYILTNFFSCALIGLALYYKKPANIYVLAGFAWNLFATIRGGMFGSLIFFVVYYLLLYMLQKEKKVKWVQIIPIGLIGIWLIALLQIVKGDYRDAVWTGEEEANTENFSNVVYENASLKSVTDIDFYIPVLFRLNQGFLVSAVMQKVPSREPFANGSTIISAVVNAFVPRFLNPNKEEAGGRDKIPRFTNLTLVGSTSMNIGLLGEAYANFRKVGGVLFIMLYGCIIGIFEKKILAFSSTQPIILVLFPIYFQMLIGSGTDFLSVFNAIVKSTMFLAVVIYFFYKRKMRNDAKINAIAN